MNLNDAITPALQGMLKGRPKTELLEMLRVCGTQSGSSGSQGEMARQAIKLIMDELASIEATERQQELVAGQKELIDKQKEIISQQQKFHAESGRESQRLHDEMLADEERRHKRTQRVAWYAFWVGLAGVVVGIISMILSSSNKGSPQTGTGKAGQLIPTNSAPVVSQQPLTNVPPVVSLPITSAPPTGITNP